MELVVLDIPFISNSYKTPKSDNHITGSDGLTARHNSHWLSGIVFPGCLYFATVFPSISIFSGVHLTLDFGFYSKYNWDLTGVKQRTTEARRLSLDPLRIILALKIPEVLKYLDNISVKLNGIWYLDMFSNSSNNIGVPVIFKEWHANIELLRIERSSSNKNIMNLIIVALSHLSNEGVEILIINRFEFWLILW